MKVKLEEQLKPLLDLSNLNDDLEKLKDLMPTNKNKVNSPEYDELNDTDNIFLLVNKYSDDTELGAKVRELCNRYTSDSDNTEE